MHIGLINNWNSVVSANDEVFILGDFSFRGVTRTNLILSQLNGRKILIQGNHDSGCKNSSFDEKYFNLTLDLGGHTVELSHFPKTPKPLINEKLCL
jgi:calcineurin-like phosphoesterase family protein